MKLRRTWLLKHWRALAQCGITPNELTVMYWRDVEGKNFADCAAGIEVYRDDARRLYAKGHRKLKLLMPIIISHGGDPYEPNTPEVK